MSNYAIVSTFDKSGIEVLANQLVKSDFTIISTGGTYKKIFQSLSNDDKSKLIKVSDFTGFPEILNGRVKTLHPKIYGGILAKANDLNHSEELDKHDIPNIELVVCNLYPFHKTRTAKIEMNDALELIDIGGVTLIRAAAKNWPSVTTLTDPSDYSKFCNILNNGMLNNKNVLSSNFRRIMSIKAFNKTSMYDKMISNYLSGGNVVDRTYKPIINMKYGCNPHQSVSYVANISNGLYTTNPISVLNGTPGYINMLDAINSWQLVNEAGKIFGKSRTVVASFKHTSPAGVAIGKNASEAFEIARSCDPMSSFGDFIAINGLVDVETAKMIKREVSDGIIAPSYSTSAINILSKKKSGKYLILQVDPEYEPFDGIENPLEFREMWGISLVQSSNTRFVTHEVFVNSENIPTNNKTISNSVQDDLLLANITLKYAQSNNVVMAKDGQIIGVAAGQQSRVDAVKLAGRKATMWWLRKHPKTLALKDLFVEGVKRQDRVNAGIRYVEGDFTEIEYEVWKKLFTSVPDPLTQQEKDKWMKQLKNVAMASDAFFPFRDNIDHASKFGVGHVIQPGGSVADPSVIEACNQYDMTMTMTNLRMFTH
tara:strand:- start:16017 stop:17807 length:1791 start_codon:yes stop_codon:yes gene_type:complete